MNNNGVIRSPSSAARSPLLKRAPFTVRSRSDESDTLAENRAVSLSPGRLSKWVTYLACRTRRERCDMQLTDQSVSPCSLQIVIEKRP